MSFLQYSAEISFVHTSLIAVTNNFALLSCFLILYFSVAFTNFQSGLGLDCFRASPIVRYFSPLKTFLQLYSIDKGPHHV